MRKSFFSDMEKAVLFGLVFSVLISLAGFESGCDDLRKNVLRLHIIANSDSDYDQAVKLKVRDKILSLSGNAFDNCTDLKDAESTVSGKLRDYESAARGVLAENGFNYGAKAELKEDWFDIREYDDFTLPAGNYRSLTVTLGEGKGHNWWCVIYPSVCLGSSSKALSKSVGKKGCRIATAPKKYVYRFKIAEIYQKIKRKFR